jgi:hypothetical protein
MESQEPCRSRYVIRGFETIKISSPLPKMNWGPHTPKADATSTVLIGPGQHNVFINVNNLCSCIFQNFSENDFKNIIDK